MLTAAVVAALIGLVLSPIAGRSMRVAAVLAALIGVVFKLIAARTAGWLLVPLAAGVGAYHIRVHALAAEATDPPTRLAAVSNGILLVAMMCQIDFDPELICGWDTLRGAAYRLGWWSPSGCNTLVGVPGIILDLVFYIPVAVTWFRLRAVQALAAVPR